MRRSPRDEDERAQRVYRTPLHRYDYNHRIVIVIIVIVVNMLSTAWWVDAAAGRRVERQGRFLPCGSVPCSNVRPRAACTAGKRPTG